MANIGQGLEFDTIEDYRQYLINRDRMRKVYNTKEGSLMLADLLNDLGFYAMNGQTEADIAMENSAKGLLYKLGIWRPENMLAITEALLGMPYATKDEHG